MDLSYNVTKRNKGATDRRLATDYISQEMTAKPASFTGGHFCVR